MAKKFVSASMLQLTESLKGKIKPSRKKKKKTKEKKASQTTDSPISKKKSWVAARFDFKNAFGAPQKKSERKMPTSSLSQSSKPEASRIRNVVAHTSESNVVTRVHTVTKDEKDRFRSSVNLRTKDYVNRSLQCEICNQLYKEGYRYADREGWISYLCKSCAKQVGGPSGRKLIISTPMGGQNKKY